MSAANAVIALTDRLEPMPPRRRRSSPRSRARRSGSLSYLLVAVLVVGVGYLLIQRGVLPTPPGPTRPAPHVDGAADNRAAIARLGGTVQYGHVDPATGQRSGIRATITPAMVAAAAHDELGSAADPRTRFPDRLPLPPFPDEGGVLPVGRTDNGDELYWVTDGDPTTGR